MPFLDGLKREVDAYLCVNRDLRRCLERRGHVGRLTAQCGRGHRGISPHDGPEGPWGSWRRQFGELAAKSPNWKGIKAFVRMGMRSIRRRGSMAHHTSTLTCPRRGAAKTEEMPVNFYLWFYECALSGVAAPESRRLLCSVPMVIAPARRRERASGDQVSANIVHLLYNPSLYIVWFTRV